MGLSVHPPLPLKGGFSKVSKAAMRGAMLWEEGGPSFEGTSWYDLPTARVVHQGGLGVGILVGWAWLETPTGVHVWTIWI